MQVRVLPEKKTKEKNDSNIYNIPRPNSSLELPPKGKCPRKKENI